MCDHMFDKKVLYNQLYSSNMLLITYMLKPECECLSNIFVEEVCHLWLYYFYFNQLVNKASFSINMRNKWDG